MKKAHSILKILLYPIQFVYYIVILIRNFLYDKKILKVKKVPVYTISVGNLSTGGTGKTEVARYLIEFFLKKGIKPAYLSRGYKRKTKGYLLVNSRKHTVDEVGDEALMIAKNFPNIPVAVAENRYTGAMELLSSNKFDVLILDDAFQHRKIHRDFDILSINANKFPWDDSLLPVGNLREPRKNMKRADLFFINKVSNDVVTRKNNLTEEEVKQEYISFFRRIKSRLSPIPAIFTKYEVAYLMPFNGKYEVLSKRELIGRNVIVFSGIADSEYFKKLLTDNGAYIVKFYSFPDHHNFSEKDIKRIIRRYEKIKTLSNMSKEPIILTTEKDAARLWNNPYFEELFSNIPLYYTKIKLNIIHNEEKLKEVLNITEREVYSVEKI